MRERIQKGDLGGGDRFWGDTFFEKNGISAIGICGTSANWFPLDDMDQAIRVIAMVDQPRRMWGIHLFNILITMIPF